jgi:hypothetical protein
MYVSSASSSRRGGEGGTLSSNVNHGAARSFIGVTALGLYASGGGGGGGTLNGAVLGGGCGDFDSTPTDAVCGGASLLGACGASASDLKYVGRRGGGGVSTTAFNGQGGAILLEWYEHG